MGDCYFLCGRSGVTLNPLLHIVRDVNGCLSPQGVARRRYRRPLSPSGSGRRYHVLTSFLARICLFLPLGLVRHVVSLRLSFQEELHCRPGVKGGYMAQAYHLYVSLHEGPCPSVPRHFPPGPCGGSTGLGLTLACLPGHSNPNDSGLTFNNSILCLSPCIHRRPVWAVVFDGKCMSPHSYALSLFHGNM